MNREQYRKGNKLVVVGFLFSLFFRLLPVLYYAEYLGFSWVKVLIPYSVLLSFVFLGILIWGSVLVLKSKGRHWAWVFLLIFNIIGLIIIYSLENKNKEQVVSLPIDQPQN